MSGTVCILPFVQSAVCMSLRDLSGVRAEQHARSGGPEQGDASAGGGGHRLRASGPRCLNSGAKKEKPRALFPKKKKNQSTSGPSSRPWLRGLCDAERVHVSRRRDSASDSPWMTNVSVGVILSSSKFDGLPFLQRVAPWEL